VARDLDDHVRRGPPSRIRPDELRVVAGGGWIRDDDTFEMTWQFVEGPSRDTVRVHFDGPTMTLDREVNVNTGPTARPTIRGIWRTRPGPALAARAETDVG
jgi:hypothetical protein